ncbi:hypothetical protein EG328_010671 [Venturia inaequalis]|uniref:Uncharacterized protein n=1 Tax=Venturia inaequalis TaxID=5025 RepID=A0A8H3YKV4_VENIN|nr:hypothetical protein EG328_010671 [Venturia inaequalis]
MAWKEHQEATLLMCFHGMCFPGDSADFSDGGSSNDRPTAFCLHIPRLCQWVDVLPQMDQDAVTRPVPTDLEARESQKFDALSQLVGSMVQLDPPRRPASSV